jgi:hypothetical protein
MRRILPFIFPILFVPALAWAKIPPAFFIYGQIAEQANRAAGTAVAVSVSRPLGSGNEEVLGTKIIPSWSAAPEGWPGLSLLFAPNADSLIESVKAFGIPVALESDLVRHGKEQIYAAKEPIRPFYKTDSRMKMRRLRKTFAWVHTEGEKSIWVEKDSFLPLKIEAPCPKEVAELSWAKSNSGPCELEFRNIMSARRGNPSNSRLTLWRDGNPLLFISFDRVVPAKNADSLKTSGAAPSSAEVQQLLEILLH